jgi:hypothetical protein
MNNVPTYEALIGSKHMGFVTAISLATARAKAVRKWGPFVDVELSLDRKPRPSDRRLANVCQQGKTARRYPTPGFEARRAALLAEYEASK